MIHHSCDLCKRLIDTEQDVRYVVKMEVYAALDPALDKADDDRDGLEEVQEMMREWKRRTATSWPKTKCIKQCASICAPNAAKSSSSTRWDAKR